MGYEKKDTYLLVILPSVLNDCNDDSLVKVLAE